MKHAYDNIHHHFFKAYDDMTKDSFRDLLFSKYKKRTKAVQNPTK